ncbi:hypothetical protein [Halorubrum trueperi]|uniref:Uncharacterized protein n=1 Tax=Halorubrum trueperi TaxID=2004704 RepID=A0ABD5UG30_9EURY
MLTTILTGGVATVAGCNDTGGASDPSRGALSSVSVEGTTLAVEFESETDATQLAVLAPSGEAFADRELTPGASRETIPLGTSYPPGTYTIQLVDGDSVMAAVEQPIRPDIAITDLQLARNHPDEMYEGAGDLTVSTEVIVGLENTGSGPEQITALQFSGDIPNPTPDDLSGSGIAAPEEPVRFGKPTIEPGESLTIYSRSLPFSPNSSGVECTPEGTDGQFTTTLTSSVTGEETERTYTVTYRGDSLSECQIAIEERDS